MLWSFMGCIVDASVEEGWKTVGGIGRASQQCDRLWDLRGHV